MRFDRLGTEEQLRGRLSVRRTLRDRQGYLQLLRRELTRRRHVARS